MTPRERIAEILDGWLSKAEMRMSLADRILAAFPEIAGELGYVKRQVDRAVPINGDYAAACYDCGRQYGDEHGFPDLIIPYADWKVISPTCDDGGLLCPSCICARLYKKGIRCEGAFASGPIVSVTEPTMNALRRVENIELAIEGRNNKWAEGIRALGLTEG